MPPRLLAPGGLPTAPVAMSPIAKSALSASHSDCPQAPGPQHLDESAQAELGQGQWFVLSDLPALTALLGRGMAPRGWGQ